MSTETLKAQPCFFCTKPISGKAVVWQQGNNWAENPEGKGLINLHLHPKCAVSLGTRLAGDAFDADSKVDDLEGVLKDLRWRIEGHLQKSKKGKKT